MKLKKQLVVPDKNCLTFDKDVMCFINVRQADFRFNLIELALEIDFYYRSKGKPLVDNSRSNNKKCLLQKCF